MSDSRGLFPDVADRDEDARRALWSAVRTAALRAKTQFDVHAVRSLDGNDITAQSAMPDVQTWRLVEALSLLTVILRSDRARCATIDVLGKTGPVTIIEDGVERHLWAQQTLGGEMSTLDARPDLIVTSTRIRPYAGNAVRIIDAKCVRKIGSQTVRTEFGKAHDLRVATYLIWSFFSPTERIVAGARGLGIDLEAIGFDTDQRTSLLSDPNVLIGRFAYAQEQARKSQRFAAALQDASDLARRKLLGSAE